METLNNKRAVFFTMLSILALAILLAAVSLRQSTSQTSESLDIRIESVNNFLDQLLTAYVPLSLEAATINAMQSTALDMNQTRVFLKSPGVEIGQVVLNGTLGEVSITANSTLVNFSDDISVQASQALGVELVLTPQEVVLNQSSPWNIDIHARIDLDASTESAQWQRRNVTVSTRISIVGLLDPLYLVNLSGGLYDKRVIPTTISSPLWNRTGVDQLIKNETYHHFENSVAPTFLSRFSKNFTASSCCGIVSIVNPDRLLNDGDEPDHNESYVDYQFFNNSISCDNVYRAAGLNPSFDKTKFNFDYMIKFNVTDTSEDPPC